MQLQKPRPATPAEEESGRGPACQVRKSEGDLEPEIRTLILGVKTPIFDGGYY